MSAGAGPQEDNKAYSKEQRSLFRKEQGPGPGNNSVEKHLAHKCHVTGLIPATAPHIPSIAPEALPLEIPGATAKWCHPA